MIVRSPEPTPFVPRRPVPEVTLRLLSSVVCHRWRMVIGCRPRGSSNWASTGGPTEGFFAFLLDEAKLLQLRGRKTGLHSLMSLMDDLHHAIDGALVLCVHLADELIHDGYDLLRLHLCQSQLGS